MNKESIVKLLYSSDIHNINVGLALIEYNGLSLMEYLKLSVQMLFDNYFDNGILNHEIEELNLSIYFIEVDVDDKCLYKVNVRAEDSSDNTTLVNYNIIDGDEANDKLKADMDTLRLIFYKYFNKLKNDL